MRKGSMARRKGDVRRGSIIYLLCRFQDEYDVGEEINDQVDQIYLNFDAAISMTNFTVTSMCFYAFPSDCGTPEIPLNVKLKYDFDLSTEKTDVYSYECIRNSNSLITIHSGSKYELQPHSYVSCERDAKWSGKIQDCKPTITCDLPTNETNWKQNKLMINNKFKEAFEYVNAEYYDSELVAVPFTVEIHFCNHEIIGERICIEEHGIGMWRGAFIACDEGNI
ncbi:hypothetical protein B4U79_17567 [Dinothrombium tinctorium]|uniref:Sushi domain-containing protein n=1 Tax=Dinothrombium tinctorium TaxID=1965070 RepID=A0A3S3PJM7_9ACAR|nr:hypothetical protein B4U79_17567 [Dinothrombium tinctorium]